MNDTSDTSFDTVTLQEADRHHHLHPFTDPQALMQAPPFMVDKAEGVFIEGQGVRLLDAMAGLGCVNIGYGNREMADAASEMMQKLSYYHSFSGISNPPAALLSQKLASLAPGTLNKVFFANSGSEANETIIKLVHMYWQRLGKANKRIFISRDLAYHGSTIATTALNGTAAMQEPFGIRPQGQVEHVMAPFWYRHGGNNSPDDFGLLAARAIEDKILEIGADNVAAFIGEPIQGSLGAVIPPDTYWPEVERICRQYDVLLIADEVVTGFGRTGTWFAQEKFGFQADMMTLAKGLSSGYQPISAAMISDTIAEVLSGTADVIQHGFTTSAHPVAAAVALKNIEILQREGLVDRVQQSIGPYFAKAMAGLADHPLVGEVRTCGMICGIELAKDKQTRAQYPQELGLCGYVSQAALGQGIIVRPGGNVVMLFPPLVMEESHVDILGIGLRNALDQVHAALVEEGMAQGQA